MHTTYTLTEAPADLGALDVMLKGICPKVRWLTFTADTGQLDVALSEGLTETEEAALRAAIFASPPPKAVKRPMAVRLSNRVEFEREVKALWR